VYSSADEEIDDVNELQDEYESVSSEEDCVLFVLEVGDVFESWDFAEKQVVYCAKNNGFEVKKFRLEKNKGEIVRRTFKCKFSGVYRAQKKADIEDTCERESVRMNCPWNINLRLTGDLVYVTSLCNEHNHSLEKKNFVSNRQLSPEILEEIKFLVNIGCGAGSIIRALQKCFPETVIHPKYVYNAICRFWNIQNKSKSDAAETFEKLMKLQREEHGCSATLFELDTHIQSLLNKEEKFEQHEQSNQNPTMQHNQMNESLLYRANRVEDWNDLLENGITVGEGQDEDGEDDEDYEDGEDGEDGDY
ncbi:2103_t:CDS:2, partial [Rhizophagus irregularis]